MATISLCMIVKNEESVLARCLDSIADLMDEIIIVDTGSTDHTKEIAANYTDKIFDFLPLFSHRHGNPPNILTLLYSQLVIYTFPKDGSAYTDDISPFL